MNKTPILQFVSDRKKQASTNKEGSVELRITFERKQKYITSGVRVLKKQWHKGTRTVIGRFDAAELNETLEKLVNINGEVKKAEKRLKGLTTMLNNLESLKDNLEAQIAALFLGYVDQATTFAQMRLWGFL